MAKQPRVYATVGPFVFAYPHLTSPDTEGQYADNKYKTSGVGDPKSKGMVKAQEAIEGALKALGLPKKGVNLPLKKEKEKNEAGKKVETGKLVFTAKSKYAPAIVDAQGEAIPAKVLKKLKIGAGSEGLLEGYFSSYTKTDKIKDADGNIEEVETPGIAFTLTGVQLIKVVKGGGQGASFGAYEGGGFSAADLDDDDDDDQGGDTGLDDDDDEGGLDI